MIAPTIALCGWATAPTPPDVTQDDEAKSLEDDNIPQNKASGGEAAYEGCGSQEDDRQGHEDGKSRALGLGGWLPHWMAALAKIIH